MFFLFGVRKADAQTAAIAGTLEPSVSIAVGILFLHEKVTLKTGIGSVLILTAVVLIAIYGSAKSEKAQQ
jgi:drug/metabolite transporter (DMT)-like permease